MQETITITLAANGEDANARTFAIVLNDVLNALDAMARTKKAHPEWRIVALEKNSPPKITFSGASVGVVAAFLHLMSGLQKGTIKDAAPEVLKPIKRLVDRLGDRLDFVEFESPQFPATEPIRPTQQVSRNAAQLLMRGFYEAPSSLDGRLDIVNVHKAARFSIFEEIDGREIRCKFPQKLLDDVKRSIGKVITAVGNIRYNAESDLPVSIDVESIEPREESAEFITEGHPVDVAGGLPSEEYIRRMRDGDGA